MIKLYAIPNCNTVKKARVFLEENNIDYDFHNFKKDGANADKLKQWCDKFGWDKVVNRAGMTWRKLDDAAKAQITGDASAIELMQEKTSIIKRPVLEIDGEAKLLGFKQDEYEEWFG